MNRSVQEGIGEFEVAIVHHLGRGGLGRCGDELDDAL